jgi:hypothetical protein
MNSSRPLLFLLASAIAIGLALVVVLSPDEQPAPLRDLDSEPNGTTQASEAELESSAPNFAASNTAEQEGSTREAAPTEQHTAPELLSDFAHVKLRVLDQDGSPIEGASLRGASFERTSEMEMLGFLDWDAPQTSTLQVFGDVVSAEDGTIQFKVPAESHLLLELAADGFATCMRPCEPLTVDQELALGDVRLQEGAELRVEVQDTLGNPIEGVSVVAWSGDELPLMQSGEFPVREMMRCRTDQDGLAHFQGLPKIPAASYEIWGEQLQSPSSIEMMGPAGDEARHRRYVLPPANRVHGRIVNEQGEAIEGVKVLVLDPANSMAQMFQGEEPDIEDLLEQRPGIADQIGFGLLEIFETQITDAQGRFSQEYYLDEEKAAGIEPLFAVVAVVDETLAVESTWHRAVDELILTVPSTRLATGRILDADQVALAGCELHFRRRHDLMTEEEGKESQAGIAQLEGTAIETDSAGKFSARLPADRYWIEAVYPGGRTIFEGPYDLRNGDLELGDLVVAAGRTVELVAVPDDGSTAMEGLRGMRESPDDDDDLGFLVPPPAVHDSEDAASEWERTKDRIRKSSQRAEVDGLIAHWHNESEGEWEYALTAPGWVPAFVTLELTADSPATHQEVPMTRAGKVIVHVLTADGKAPDGLILELAPARGTQEHPLYERRKAGAEDDGWYNHDREPVDAESTCRFDQVLPGQYEVFAMSEADSNNFFGPDEENRPAIVSVEVLAGSTVEVDASIANLAELTVLVTRRGVPVEGAQVFNQVLPEQFGLMGIRMFGNRFGRQDPSGTTDAQGQLVLSSLSPGSQYQIGARHTQLGPNNWQESDAWTTTYATLQSGPQSITIELGAGSVRLQVQAAPNIEVEVKLARMQELEPPPADASEQENHMHESIAEHFANQTQEDLFDSSTVATRVTSGGATVEFLGLEPGLYQVMLESDAGDARGFSAKFEVNDRIIDLGAVGMMQLGRVEIQLLGTEQLNEENRFSLDLECIPSGGDHAVESTGWLRDTGKQNWNLPAGSYFLQLKQHNKVIGTSPPFSVSSGSTTPFSWQIPAIQTGG